MPVATSTPQANPTDTSDFELLDAWAAGDDRAGNRLFKRHFDAVYRFFRNKIDRGAEDLVQQTFMAAVEGRHRFRRESSFKTYLFATARYVLYGQYRRKRRDAIVDFNSVSAMDLGASPSSMVAKKAEQRLLLESLRTISMDYQVILELYMWEGLTGPQLARILDIGEPGVRSRLRRAKAALRTRMSELADSPERLDSTLHNLEDWAESLRVVLSC